MHLSHCMFFPVIFHTLQPWLFPTDIDQEFCHSVLLHCNLSAFVLNWVVDWGEKKTLRWKIYLSQKSRSCFILMKAIEKKGLKLYLVPAGVIKVRHCLSCLSLSRWECQKWRIKEFFTIASVLPINKCILQSNGTKCIFLWQSLLFSYSNSSAG